MVKHVRKAVFPAAGLGTRFLPATKASPKEMLSLVDKPLIQYVVEEAVASGIESVIIVTGRGKSAIEDHFDVSFELEVVLRERGKEADLTLVRRITDMARFSYVRQREALVLHHLVGLAVTEVASELGVPVGTVKAWLSRGRRRLASALSPESTVTRREGQVQ